MDKSDTKLAFNMGSKFHDQGDLKKALFYYKKALTLSKETNNTKEEVDIFLGIGDLYLDMDNTEKAQKYYEKYLKLCKKNNDDIGEGYALTGLGITFGKYEKYEESREYYGKALRKFQKAKDFNRASIISNLIAKSYELQDALEDAIIDYNRSLKLFKKVKFKKVKDRKREFEIKRTIRSLQPKRSKIKSSKTQILILFFYLIAIVTGEIVTTYYNTGIGIIIHITILFTILIHSSFVESYNFSNLLRSLMALPMIRIIGIVIPTMNLPDLYKFPIIAIPLFAASFTIIRSQKISRLNLGLTLGNIPVQLGIALTGIVLGFIEYQILHPKPLMPYFNLETVIIVGFILLISTGFAEELLFRGIIQKNAENIFGSAFGLLYASLLFTALHVIWHSIWDLIFVFGVALLYGYAFQKTRSLFGITLSHGMSNTFLFLVIPLLFS